MTLAFPWALLGLLAVPALAAIYWLRQRARRREVSSLLLWRDEPESRASGRRFDRFEAPPLFLLELLILLLLVAAAAGPQVPIQGSRRPLVVVLDDSFSMLAGGEASPRAAAAAGLVRELEDRRHAGVTLVRAGVDPQVLGEGATLPDEVAAQLVGWRGTAPMARLEEAVALARDVGGDRARILMLTDHPPPEPLVPGRVWWWAFGRAVANLAVVNAVRSPQGRDEASDGCLVEIANFSPLPATARLTVAAGGVPGAGFPAGEKPSRLELASGEIGRFRFSAPRGKPVHLHLAPDALEIDDRVVLLPERSRSVRVALEIGDAALRELIGDALAASDLALVSRDSPELVITDAAEAFVGGETGAAWRLRLDREGEAVPYLGPFVLDRGHPMTEGLALDGVIWAAGVPGAGVPAAGVPGASAPAADALAPGAPVVAAGDVALLTDRETADGRHLLTLRWQGALSTLQRTPNWPILWWNLLEWRAASVPGVRAANLRLGSDAAVGLAAGAEAADLVLPGGSVRRLAAAGGRLLIRAEEVGIHRLDHGGRSDRWAVNALTASESDLRHAARGRWGGWGGDAEARWERRSLAWILLLAAVALLVLHLAWTAPGRASA